MASGVTAVITVLFLTDVTKAVPSTNTTELRAPLSAARWIPSVRRPSVWVFDVDSAPAQTFQRMLGEGRGVAPVCLREQIRERWAGLPALARPAVLPDVPSA